VFLPLNTGYQKGELAYFFADAEPRVIVCRPDAADMVAALRPASRVMTLAAGAGTLLDRAADERETFETVRTSPDDLAAILYTSGTTGRPKGAMLTHRNLGSNALALVDCWGFTRGDVLLHALPIYHVHGLFVACHCALLSGSHMLWLAKFDPMAVRQLLPRATVMMGVPTFYTRLLGEASFGAADCASMRLFISGSAPLLAETFEQFRQRTGNTILERYGCPRPGCSRRTRSSESASPARSAPRSPASWYASSTSRARPAPAAKSAASRSRDRTCSAAIGACRRDLATISPPTGTSVPATSGKSWITGTFAWSAARRTWSSRAGSTSIRRKSRRRSTRCPTSSNRR
jgi:acyl-CoA synthetase (AMP-forming)/AMP-acid ligase II